MGRPSRHKVYNKIYQEEAINYKNYLDILGLNPQTTQARYLYLREFLSWLEILQIYQIQEVRTVEISNYYDYLLQRKSTRTRQNIKQKSIHDHMRNLQQYLGYLLDLGKIKTSPASHLKFSHPNEKVERIIFTQNEIQELYKASNEQEKAILNIAYGCGLRVGELSLINKEDIRFTENLLIVQKGKNNKRRVIPITNQIVSELESYINSQTESTNKAIFINNHNVRMQEWTFNKILKELISKTKFGQRFSTEELNKIGIHSLRHSIATHLLENGMKIEQVQTFLGHSHIESTEIYTHINQNQINELRSNHEYQ
jgi:integrase/recombinase XerD